MSNTDCTYCHVVLRPEMGRCWLCGQPVGASPREIFPGWGTRAGADYRTFGLRVLVITVAVAAVLLAVARAEPVLGILLAYAVIPALLLTGAVIVSRRAMGLPMDWVEQFQEYAGSIVTAIGFLWIFILILAPFGGLLLFFAQLL